jgi:hypothetical protein
VSNFYGSPGDFGLAPVGEIDWSDGCYQFDYTVVWRRMDGRLVYAEDSGCSCPSPFEDQDASDLIVIKPMELQAHLEKRQADAYGEAAGYRAAEIADLMHRVMSAVSVPGRLAREDAAIEAGGSPS